MEDKRFEDEALEAMSGVAKDFAEAVREDGSRETPAGSFVDDDIKDEATKLSAASQEPSKKKADSEAKQRSMTRRAALVGVPAFLIGLAMWKPQKAWAADWPTWAGAQYQYGKGVQYDPVFWSEIGDRYYSSGVSDYGDLFTGRWFMAKTPWCEWDLDIAGQPSYWPSSSTQLIAAATKLTISCDFSTELYFHVTAKLELACHSWDSKNKTSRWHRNSGTDNWIELYHYNSLTGYKTETDSNGRRFKTASLSNDPDDGSYVQNLWHGNDTSDGEWERWYTAFQEWDGGYPWSIWIRRQTTDVNDSFQLKSWFSNFYYYNWLFGGTSPYYLDTTNDDTVAKGPWPIGWSTKWCNTTAKARTIDLGLAWQGRILEFAPKAVPKRRLDVTGGGTSNEVQLCIWDSYECTNQNFEACLASTNDPQGCVALAPVNCGQGGKYVDMKGGGPTNAYYAPCQIYDGNGSRAQSIWIHDTEDVDVQQIFSDCSGYALDRSNAGTDNGTYVQWHSDGACDRSGGLDGKFSNGSHEWHVKDAVFHQRKEYDGHDPFAFTGLNSEGVAIVGKKIGVTDPASYCCPRKYNSSENSLLYSYSWALLDGEDDGAWVENLPDIMGLCHVSDLGRLKREMPANNFIGQHIGKRLEAFEMHLSGGNGKLSGGIEYQLRPQGGNWPDKWAADGSWTGQEGTGYKADLLRIRLTGDIAKKCDVVYAVNYVDGNWDWTWKRNGEAAGTSGRGIKCFCARIQPKAISGMSFTDSNVPATITPTDEMAGYKLACFVRCNSNGPWTLQYRGTVGVVSKDAVEFDAVKVTFFIDGEEFRPLGKNKVSFKIDTTIHIEDEWTEKAKKYGDRDKSCSGFYGWYTDPECTKPWGGDVTATQDLAKTGINLYARNKVEVDFQPSTHAVNMLDGRELYTRDGAPGSIHDLPAKWTGWYGEKVDLTAPANTVLLAYDAGKLRSYESIAGAYRRDYTSGDKPEVAAWGKYEVKSTMTFYYDWDDAPYDGFIGK